MPKMSFRDPITNVLVSWGYTTANKPNDIGQVEVDTFNLAPGYTQWNGSAWVSFTPVSTGPTQLQQTLSAAASASTMPALQQAFTALANQFAAEQLSTTPPNGTVLTSSQSVV
jgi:hypothetical protein